jgi:hypothetical protein
MRRAQSDDDIRITNGRFQAVDVDVDAAAAAVAAAAEEEAAATAAGEEEEEETSEDEEVFISLDISGRGLHSSTSRLIVITFVGYAGWFHVVSVTKTAQVALRSGRVEASDLRRPRAQLAPPSPRR